MRSRGDYDLSSVERTLFASLNIKYIPVCQGTQYTMGLVEELFSYGLTSCQLYEEVRMRAGAFLTKSGR